MTTESKARGVWSVMKRGTAVVGLVALIGLVQGCIIETSSGPPPVCFDSALTFDWVVTVGGAEVQCPAGSVVTIRVDNDTMIADFPCNAHAGTTDATLTGNRTHTVDFYLTQGNTTLSKLEGVPVPVACGVTQPLSDTVEFSLTP